jgi:hypothetical protein
MAFSFASAPAASVGGLVIILCCPCRRSRERPTPGRLALYAGEMEQAVFLLRFFEDKISRTSRRGPDAFWLSAAREAHKAAAPYYAPRLQAIHGMVRLDGSDEQQEDRADPRQTMWETYLEMRFSARNREFTRPNRDLKFRAYLSPAVESVTTKISAADEF